jgi:hypothetical protein
MKHTLLTFLAALLLAPLATLHTADAADLRPNILPDGWDALQAANRVSWSDWST